MKNKILIYGANGFSAKLIIKEFEKYGISPVLAGRNADKVFAVADIYKLDYRVFGLDDPQLIKQNLSDIQTVLNCAGPFRFTAEKLIDSCIESGTNYLDITGEIPVFEYAFSIDKDAENNNVVVLPGVGFDVIPTDTLAKRLSGLMPDATELELGFQSVGGKLSHGTMLSTLESLKDNGKIRLNGEIVDSPVGYFTKEFDRQGFNFTGITIPWGDVSTAFHSTGIPNIKVYMGIPSSTKIFSRIAGDVTRIAGIDMINRGLKMLVNKTVTGPGQSQRNSTKVYVWGAVRNNSGSEIMEAYQVMEGYNLTAKGAVESVKRVNSGEVKPGFKTPSLAFGADFLNQFTINRIF